MTYFITEVEGYGTSLKTFASGTAVAVGELEAMVFQSDMVYLTLRVDLQTG